MGNQHWNRFWQQGFITTFGESLGDNYSGEIRKFWQGVFTQMKDGDHVLDLATGSGALACIAVETALDAGIEIDVYAADAAIIPNKVKAPEPIVRCRERINFFSEMPCEHLDFPPEFFQLVTSQYGIEYASWGHSLAEVHRVLKAGGEAHFVCHRNSARIVKNSAVELGVYEAAFNDYGIFDAAEKFARNYGGGGANRATEAQALNRVMNLFRERYRAEELCRLLVSDIAAQLKNLKAQPANDVASALAARKAEYAAAYARLQDMCKAALGSANVQNILNEALEIGFSAADAKDVYQDDELIGVHFSLKK